MSWFRPDGGPARPYPQRIAIITDAWAPQVNGVVRTLAATCEHLRLRGHDVMMVSPDQYRSLPCPTYPEIRLAVPRPGAVGTRIDAFAPDAVHIPTEGPLGLAARRHCLVRGIPFTTAYHTQFPAYVARRTGVPETVWWRYIRWFHAPAERILVATASIRAELADHGLARAHHWSRGVDLGCFSPDASPPPEFASLPRPIQLYVGRVAVEKNIEAFLGGSYPGSKVVVGDGPAGCYAGADVFVFPSKTDTFGLVMIEALACGTPVAAHPVAGPRDVVTEAVGALSEDIDRASAAALFSDRRACIAHAAGFGWEVATDQFVAGLVTTGPAALAA